MSGKKNDREGQGTFAQLYDVQEQLSRRNSKPLGRPRKKVQRKPTTIYLTQSENRKLGRLHFSLNEYLSINRSELAGVAIDALALLLEKEGLEQAAEAQLEDAEAFRQFVYDFIKS